MCIKLPFRIYFKNIYQILKECFGLNDSNQGYKKTDMNMRIIEEQPIIEDSHISNSDSETEKESDQELEKSYDFIN